MREEEQLAHDLYARWAGMYGIPVFSNIASSETTHYSEVQLLIDRYGLTDHRIGNASAGYSDPVIQSLHTTLAAQGDASLTGALEAGLAVEERDIADLDHALANTTRADIVQVYPACGRDRRTTRAHSFASAGTIEYSFSYLFRFLWRCSLVLHKTKDVTDTNRHAQPEYDTSYLHR